MNAAIRWKPMEACANMKIVTAISWTWSDEYVVRWELDTLRSSEHRILYFISRNIAIDIEMALPHKTERKKMIELESGSQDGWRGCIIFEYLLLALSLALIYVTRNRTTHSSIITESTRINFDFKNIEFNLIIHNSLVASHARRARPPPQRIPRVNLIS